MASAIMSNNPFIVNTTVPPASTTNATRRGLFYRRPHLVRKWLLEHECNMRKYLQNPVAYLQYIFLKLTFNQFAYWLYQHHESDRSLRRLRQRLFQRHEIGAYETPMFQDFRTAIEQAHNFPVKLDFRADSNSCTIAAAGSTAAEQVYDSSNRNACNLTQSADGDELVHKWNAYIGSVMRAINVLPADMYDAQDSLDDKFEYKFSRTIGTVMRYKTNDNDQTITTIPNTNGYYADLPFNFEKLYATLTNDWTKTVFKSSSSYFGSNRSSRCQSAPLHTTTPAAARKTEENDSEGSDDESESGKSPKIISSQQKSSKEHADIEQNFVDSIEFMLKFVHDYFNRSEIQNLMYNKARYPPLCFVGSNPNEAEAMIPYRTTVDAQCFGSAANDDPPLMPPAYMMPLFNSIALQSSLSGVEHWVMKSTPGLASFHLVTDADCQEKVLEMTQSNGKIDGSYIVCPGDDYAMNCSLPFFVAIVKDLGCYFKIELSLRDSKGCTRKVRLCNYMNTYRRRVNTLVYPLKMREGVWYTVALNLRRVCATAFRRGYDRIMRIAVHPNCRLRAVYMANRVYDNNSTELPQWLRLGGSRGGAAQHSKSYHIDPFSFDKINQCDETTTAAEDESGMPSVSPALNAHQQQQYRALARYSVRRAKIARQWQTLVEQQQQETTANPNTKLDSTTAGSSQHPRRKAISGGRNKNIADLSVVGGSTAASKTSAVSNRLSTLRSRSIHSVWSSNNSAKTGASADLHRHVKRSESQADLERIKEGCDDSSLRLSAEDLEEFRYHTVGGSLLSSSYAVRRHNNVSSTPLTASTASAT